MSEREPSQDDAVWQDLVARLESAEAAPDPQDKDTPGQDKPRPADAGNPPSRGLPGANFAAESPPEDALPVAGPRDYYAAEPEDDEFVPPEPAPLGTGEPLLVLAWCGAVGGPIALLLMAMFWRSAPFAAVVGLIVMIIAAGAYLVSRLPGERDSGDDGAQV
ncbi:hypothetical protein [Crystallibacter degradans]|uniref:hypothetical protein n=1 Tax=Crystallibacter degradans TaxID=2726743 RepID=UPI001472A2B6|nr:hypothetical protein [Arthrobacter sp. SF27]NMR30105.1 hypothetical protein [Arthrobacter sp. SF27]